MAKLHGGKKLETELAKLAAKLSRHGTLRVGFLRNATYPDGTPVALVAAIQDLGAPRAGIPPRPFFRNFIKNNKKSWSGDLAKLLKINGFDAVRALKLMGTRMRDQLQQSIRDTNEPPLKPSTLKKRGVDPTMKYDPKDPATFGAKPLIHTAKMINSVDFEVEE